MEIDASKDVYLFVHGRSDLVEKSTAALVAKGFAQEKIIQALPQKTGNVGDYMAMLWMPPKETEFCSCSAYFFGKMRDGKGCYHVSSVQMSGTNVQTTKFPDSQYGAFLAELVERISATALL